MPMIEHRIVEIAEEEFAKATLADIQTWLLGAITSWSKEESVLSFTPFQNFFPSMRDEFESLGMILKGLPRSKSNGRTYSLNDQFRRALVNIISTKDVYLNHPDTWVLLLDLAKNIKLNESIESLKLIMSDFQFREKASKAEIPLFDSALKFSFNLDTTPDACAFWEACIPYIDKAPHLSVQLLMCLIDATPEKWAGYVSNPKLRGALTRYYYDQSATDRDACDRYFERLKNKISKLPNEIYRDGLGKLTDPRSAGFLINLEHVNDFGKWQEKEGNDRLVTPFESWLSEFFMPEPVQLNIKNSDYLNKVDSVKESPTNWVMILPLNSMPQSEAKICETLFPHINASSTDLLLVKFQEEDHKMGEHRTLSTKSYWYSEGMSEIDDVEDAPRISVVSSGLYTGIYQPSESPTSKQANIKIHVVLETFREKTPIS